jgi:hypothetical protein
MFKRTETIKFREFMSGEYQRKTERKKATHKRVMKAAAVGAVGVALTNSMLPLFVAGSTIAYNARAVPVMASGMGPGVEPQVVEVAAIPEAAKEKIIHAFDPLTDLMISLSLPIAGIMLTGGALMIMIGQKEMGYRLIFNSALGYVLVQLTPLFIALLAGVGGAL